MRMSPTELYNKLLGEMVDAVSASATATLQKLAEQQKQLDLMVRAAELRGSLNSREIDAKLFGTRPLIKLTNSYTAITDPNTGFKVMAVRAKIDADQIDELVRNGVSEFLKTAATALAVRNGVNVYIELGSGEDNGVIVCSDGRVYTEHGHYDNHGRDFWTDWRMSNGPVEA